MNLSVFIGQSKYLFKKCITPRTSLENENTIKYNQPLNILGSKKIRATFYSN